MAEAPDEVFYAHLARELGKGRLTPFLGAGVNLIGIDTSRDFIPGSRLPSSTELARHLAREFAYPETGKELDLVRVAQWVFSRLGAESLYDYLHDVFDHDFPATPVHQVLARMPAFVRSQEGAEYPLIITTNYDDALERAFATRDEPLDVLTYVANEDDPDLGLFRHTGRDVRPRVLRVANKYQGVTLTERAAVVKLHGAVQRSSSTDLSAEDSYVVTEDDYIECLTRTEVVKNLPPAVARRMHRCHYLFLGYSLRDWNLRVMLHRIWKDRARQNNSWAVVSHPDPLEVEAWRSRSVEIYDMELGAFSARLGRELNGADQGAV
jgi:hypothetical protein